MTTTAKKPDPGLHRLVKFEEGGALFQYIAESREERVPELVDHLMSYEDIQEAFTHDTLLAYLVACLDGCIGGKGASSAAAMRAAASYPRL